MTNPKTRKTGRAAASEQQLNQVNGLHAGNALAVNANGMDAWRRNTDEYSDEDDSLTQTPGSDDDIDDDDSENDEGELSLGTCSSFSLQECINEFKARRTRRVSQQSRELIAEKELKDYGQKSNRPDSAEADLINQNRTNKEHERKCKPCKNGFCYCFTSDSGDAVAIAAPGHVVRQHRRNRKSESNQVPYAAQQRSTMPRAKEKRRQSAPPILKEPASSTARSGSKAKTASTFQGDQLRAVSRLGAGDKHAPLIHIIQELSNNCVISEVRINKHKMQAQRSRSLSSKPSPKKTHFDFSENTRRSSQPKHLPMSSVPLGKNPTPSAPALDKISELDSLSEPFIYSTSLDTSAKSSGSNGRRHKAAGLLLQKRLSHGPIQFKPRNLSEPPPKPPRSNCLVNSDTNKTSVSTLASTTPSVREAERVVDDFLRCKGIATSDGVVKKATKSKEQVNGKEQTHSKGKKERAIDNVKKQHEEKERYQIKMSASGDGSHKKRKSYPLIEPKTKPNLQKTLPTYPSLSDFERLMEKDTREHTATNEKNIHQATEKHVKQHSFGWKEPEETESIQQMLNYDANANKRQFRSQAVQAEPQAIGWHVPPKTVLDTVDGGLKQNLDLNISKKNTPVKTRVTNSSAYNDTVPQKYLFRKQFKNFMNSPWSNKTPTVATGEKPKSSLKSSSQSFLNNSKKRILRLVSPKKENREPRSEPFVARKTPLRSIGIQTSKEEMQSPDSSSTPQSPPGSYFSAVQTSQQSTTLTNETQEVPQMNFNFDRTVHSPPKKTKEVIRGKLHFPPSLNDTANGSPNAKTYQSFQSELDQDVTLSKMGLILSNIRAKLEASDDHAERTFREIGQREQQFAAGLDCTDGEQRVRHQTRSDLQRKHRHFAIDEGEEEPIYSEIEEDSIHILSSPHFDNKTANIEHFPAEQDPSALYAKVVKTPKHTNNRVNVTEPQQSQQSQQQQQHHHLEEHSSKQHHNKQQQINQHLQKKQQQIQKHLENKPQKQEQPHQHHRNQQQGNHEHRQQQKQRQQPHQHQRNQQQVHHEHQQQQISEQQQQIYEQQQQISEQQQQISEQQTQLYEQRQQKRNQPQQHKPQQHEQQHHNQLLQKQQQKQHQLEQHQTQYQQEQHLKQQQLLSPKSRLAKCFQESLKSKIKLKPLPPLKIITTTTTTNAAFHASSSSPSLPSSVPLSHSLNNIRVKEHLSPPKHNRHLSKSDLSLHRSEIFLENLCRSELIINGSSNPLPLEKVTNVNLNESYMSTESRSEARNLTSQNEDENVDEVTEAADVDFDYNDEGYTYYSNTDLNRNVDPDHYDNYGDDDDDVYYELPGNEAANADLSQNTPDSHYAVNHIRPPTNQSTPKKSQTKPQTFTTKEYVEKAEISTKQHQLKSDIQQPQQNLCPSNAELPPQEQQQGSLDINKPCLLSLPVPQHLNQSNSCPNTPRRIPPIPPDNESHVCTSSLIEVTASCTDDTTQPICCKSTLARYQRLKNAFRMSLRRSKQFVKTESKRLSNTLSFPAAAMVATVTTASFSNKSSHNQSRNSASEMMIDSTFNLDFLFALDDDDQPLEQQLAKAVTICRQLPDLEISPEMVEAERLLLFSTLRREAAKWPTIPGTVSAPSYEQQRPQRGRIYVDGMRIPIRTDGSQDLFFNYFYICTFYCGGVITSTQSVECRNQEAIFIDCGIEFAALDPEAEVSCEIFMLRLRKVSTISFERTKKSILSLSCSSMTSSCEDIVSRFRLHGSFTIRPSDFLPYEYVEQASKSSGSICLRSSTSIRIPITPRTKSTNLSTETLLMGRADMRFPMFTHRGFLNVQQPENQHHWNRRWCTLDGMFVRVWQDIPLDEEIDESAPQPLLQFYLHLRTETGALESASPELCARPRSFCLDCCVVKATDDEADSTTTRATRSVFFAAETQNDLSTWLLKLNEVLDFIAKWMK